ncbi:MAG: GlsB/YeaQ/YmgE family stress response membrane protein [Pseudomonadota bacterium]
MRCRDGTRSGPKRPQPGEEPRMHWLRGFPVGLLVGAIAKLLPPGRDRGGFIVTGLIGIAGSVLATWGGVHVLHRYAPGESAGWIASMIGAVVRLVACHALFRNKASRRGGGRLSRTACRPALPANPGRRHRRSQGPARRA